MIREPRWTRFWRWLWDPFAGTDELQIAPRGGFVVMLALIVGWGFLLAAVD